MTSVPYFSPFLCSHPGNLLPGMCVVVLMVLCGLTVVKSRLAALRSGRKADCIFLQAAMPPGHLPYAVVVDTSFWAPVQFTSRVSGAPGVAM